MGGREEVWARAAAVRLSDGGLVTEEVSEQRKREGARSKRGSRRSRAELEESPTSGEN